MNLIKCCIYVTHNSNVRPGLELRVLNTDIEYTYTMFELKKYIRRRPLQAKQTGQFCIHKNSLPILKRSRFCYRKKLGKVLTSL